LFFTRKKKGQDDWPLPFSEAHYRDIRRKNVIRLFSTYLAPLIILAIFFHVQYNSIMTEGKRFHLRAIAENQANTLDLFLSERLVNISNLIDDPNFQVPPSPQTMEDYLGILQKNSETFVDIGYFDASGIQAAYAGPYPSLEKRNYSSEAWYTALKKDQVKHIITDIYLGFRQKPHFTIAVSRIINNQFTVLRATLDPEKMYEYISTLEGSQEVYSSIVSKEGYYQVVTPHIGTPLETSSIVPPLEPGLGVEDVEVGGSSITFAYSWLQTADWALIAQQAQENTGIFSGFNPKIIGISAAVIILIFLIILNRSAQLVEMQKETDRTRAQLEHAAKLASIGELAAGIAHEINNPLAIISEEAGLMKDLMDPELAQNISNQELIPHLDNIHESVFRCRDITRKLLGFVRKTDMDMRPHDVHQLIDGVVDGILGSEMAVSNIEIIRDYAGDLPKLVTDGNQLQQVLLNIINNGVDAIEGKPGEIRIKTLFQKNNIKISISDNGCGMGTEQMEKIFMPFYTTKEVGRGTGLGLSVSYGIIKSLKGTIEVDSTAGGGTTFTITFPIQEKY